MNTGKTIALNRWTFVDKVMSLLFNMLSRLVITFLQRSKCLLISWLQSPFAVILEPKKLNSATVSPSICHEVMGPDTVILVFWILSFKPTFSPSLSLSSGGSLVPLHFCHKGGVICISEVIGLGLGFSYNPKIILSFPPASTLLFPLYIAQSLFPLLTTSSFSKSVSLLLFYSLVWCIL